MDPQSTEITNSLEQTPTNKKPFPILIVVLVLAALGISTAVVINKDTPSNKKNGGQIIPEDSGPPVKLISDPSSVNTIIYGFKESGTMTNINAVNDSSINNWRVAIIT